MTRGSRIIAALVFTTAVVYLARAQKVSPSQPVISELAKSYHDLRKLTDRGVSVNPELAASCIGVSQAQIEAVQKSFGPHTNCTVQIYMSDNAAEAFQAHAKVYPIGSVVVKEKRRSYYRDRLTDQLVNDHANGVGGMVKRSAGFDPEHGDWEYFYFEQPSKIESGRIASCVGCHSGARRTDYVFGSWSGLQPNPFAFLKGADVFHDLAAKPNK